MTHTPGPWLIAPSEFGEQLDIIADVVSEDDKLNIATVYGGFKNSGELAANANLICAAPEMAVEIIQLKAEIERLRELYSDWRETQECLERASDDAIERKAEVERLLEEVAQAKRYEHCLHEEVVAHELANERLRAALREIADLSSVSVRAPHIARAALEGK